MPRILRIQTKWLLFAVPFALFVLIYLTWHFRITVANENAAFTKLQILIKEKPDQNYYILRWRAKSGLLSGGSIFPWKKMSSGWAYLEYNRSQGLLAVTPYIYTPKFVLRNKPPYFYRPHYESGCSDRFYGTHANDNIILRNKRIGDALSDAGWDCM